MQVINAAEFARKVIEVAWLVDRLVPAYGISIIYADPKIGKSIMSLQLAHALANGRPFLDRSVPKRFRVCYLQADEPPQEWAHQLQDISQKAGYEIGEGWDTIPAPPGCLADPAMFEELKRLLQPYECVILEALVSFFGSLSRDRIKQVPWY